MKALCWHGTHDVRIDHVDDPRILNERDVLVRVTATTICGSDLHLLNGYVPTMEKGDVLGHEFMGEVVEVGSAINRLNVGDRVVVPFTISCGSCFFCKREEYSLCDESNPNAEQAAAMMGHSPAGLFGYSHMLGGFAGGQAELVRVPMADVGPLKLPDDVTDEQALFLSDIYPTGYMAAENAEIEPGETVAVWGCGPVAQFTIKSCWMLGAGRVIAIDSVPERLDMAKRHGNAEVLNFEEVNIYETLQEMTKGRGPDRCIDAVGCEGHAASTLTHVLDKAKETIMLQANRPHVLNEMVRCCRKGGTLSLPGVYTAHIDNFMVGPLMNKALSVRSGQTHMQRYLEPLLDTITDGRIDPSFVITHRARLDDAPDLYKTFRDKKDGCIKVFLRP